MSGLGAPRTMRVPRSRADCHPKTPAVEPERSNGLLQTEMPAHERDLFRADSRFFWGVAVSGVWAPVEDMQVRVYPGFAQLTVHPHRVGQEQVPGATDDQGGREPGEITKQRREIRVLQVVP